MSASLTLSVRTEIVPSSSSWLAHLTSSFLGDLNPLDPGVDAWDLGEAHQEQSSFELGRGLAGVGVLGETKSSLDLAEGALDAVGELGVLLVHLATNASYVDQVVRDLDLEVLLGHPWKVTVDLVLGALVDEVCSLEMLEGRRDMHLLRESRTTRG